jgi:hypothetical protein
MGAMKVRPLEASLALIVSAMPCMAMAEEGYPPAAGDPASGRFDLKRSLPPPVAAVLVGRLVPKESISMAEPARREKIKIRWTYQPVEGGPSFEIGTFGSRKGVMKNKMVHVALDWSF